MTTIRNKFEFHLSGASRIEFLLFSFNWFSVDFANWGIKFVNVDTTIRGFGQFLNTNGLWQIRQYS